MGAKTGIAWTESTWNPVTGCTKVSAGCKNCYAERVTERFGKDFSKVELHPDRLDLPLRWRKPRRVFVNSMSDLFHEDVPDEFIAQIFNVMACATVDCGKRHVHEEECWQGDSHTFQILTKRPARMLDVISRMSEITEYWSGEDALCVAQMAGFWPLPNVWLGTSVENQATADERIPLLLQTPAAVRFLSVEPLLEGVDLSCHGNALFKYDPSMCSADSCNCKLDWVIAGGESGPNARPCNLEWIRSIVKQCKAAGVPCFVKQLGAKSYEPSSGSIFVGGRSFLCLKDRKGGDPAEWPADLRLREYPDPDTVRVSVRASRAL